MNARRSHQNLKSVIPLCLVHEIRSASRTDWRSLPSARGGLLSDCFIFHDQSQFPLTLGAAAGGLVAGLVLRLAAHSVGDTGRFFRGRQANSSRRPWVCGGFSPPSALPMALPPCGRSSAWVGGWPGGASS